MTAIKLQYLLKMHFKSIFIHQNISTIKFTALATSLCTVQQH